MLEPNITAQPEPLDKTCNTRSLSELMAELMQIRRHVIGALAAIDKALKEAKQ